MSYFLFKLRFTAPVHFGSSEDALSLYSSEESFRADTLFSALCHTVLRSEGESGLNKLLEAAGSGSLRLSDAMPWRGEELYLPKPFFHAESAGEVSAQKRKKMKKLRWIPVCDFADFSESLHGGKAYEPEDNSFGVHIEHTKANISEGEVAKPYQVGAFQFYDDCGLWFICACPEADKEYYKRLFTLLGMSGIGGKVSSGYGSFELVDVISLDEASDGQTDDWQIDWLNEALKGEGKSYLLLTSSLPAEDEMEAALDGAYYQLVRRSGFVQSETYAATPQKKDTQYFLAAGSVLRKRFKGGLWTVGRQGGHPVYRYSSPVMLGVDL